MTRSKPLASAGATKHALEAISETFRIELLPFGIEVTIIRPGTSCRFKSIDTKTLL